MFFAAVTEVWVEWMGRGAEEFWQGQYHTLINASLHDTLPIRKGQGENRTEANYQGKHEESAILARVIYSLDNQLVTLVIIRQMAADIKTQAKIVGER